ncbi:MAG TPA: hypothetical protein VFP69_18020 [Streptomyces sp.]|nr:hypothetical protein [Streptomyces sp.]
MADWIYVLDPHRDSLEDEPADRETFRRLAEEEPGLDLWLGRRNRMRPGDRLWFLFAGPDSAVTAVAEVDEEPRETPEDPDAAFLVAATLLPEATKALHTDPVRREDLGAGQIRPVRKVTPEALPVLLKRAGL